MAKIIEEGLLKEGDKRLSSNWKIRPMIKSKKKKKSKKKEERIATPDEFRNLMDQLIKKDS